MWRRAQRGALPVAASVIDLIGSIGLH